MNRQIDVVTRLGGEDVEVGTLTVTEGRVLSSTFRYSYDYLSRTDAYALEPAMPLDDAAHLVRDGLPLSLQDSSPDHWGKNLLTMQRRADNLAGADLPSELNALDFLLGVSDVTRQGALRFRVGDGPFLQESVGVPKMLELDVLLHAADVIVEESPTGWREAVKTMLDAGTGALGGALPKAAVVDDGRLCLAKFPMLGDRVDRAVWEKTALDLAEAAGVPTPRRRIVTVAGRGVLLVERFDRRGEDRVPYISARTLAQEHGDGGTAEYEDVADALRFEGVAPRDDLVVLYRLVAVGALIHNTDNHLRNHGFLREGAGWRLAPAFDLNPNPDAGASRATSIAGSYQPRDTGRGLMAFAPYCGLDPAQARRVVAEVAEVVRRWREVAESNGATGREIERYEESFSSLDANVRNAFGFGFGAPT
ncbi:type II toxin-antitoxin system HipA family toxin [Mumia sp.]|uniref:type II toxin-antitoxin system HipA family toxin n=1 Tax=Mumia sp. TaxID=1965300 RepID=UPI00262874E8|nr:HipA domain-containing protein [Mumia sp.]MDD9350323.1 HipA domain-containing protein [Mumia sp.]